MTFVITPNQQRANFLRKEVTNNSTKIWVLMPDGRETFWFPWEISFAEN